MKPPFLALLCIPVLAVAGWIAKSALLPSRSQHPPLPVATATKVLSEASSTPSGTQPVAKTTPPVSHPLNRPVASSQATYGNSPSPSIALHRQPESPAAYAGAPGQQPKVSSNKPVSSSPVSSGKKTAPSQAPANLPTSPSSAVPADATAFELEPGVPVPAALLPPSSPQTPEVAAAQQQIADDFLETVETAINQPQASTSEDVPSEIYYDSLTLANEHYRAMYGNDAFNSTTTQAVMEAQSGN